MAVVATHEALTAIAAILAAGGIEEPRREARLILAHAIGCDPSSLFSRETVMSDAALALARRRATREPLAYITGHREFWSLELAVSPATLIPRPDSETLIEAALHHRPDRARVRTVLDLGTGTGALLLAALSAFDGAFGIGTDRIAAATALARANARHLGFGARCGFLVADWTAPLAGSFDLILSNPPYIPSPALAGLMPDVARFEPVSALDGGVDGFDAYRCIIADLPRLLAPAGIAIIEAGIGQAAGIAGLAAAAGLAAVSHADLAGVPRAIVMSAPEGVREKTIW
ncbi:MULTISPECIES: peptide chain release factor N(5)-glutamine methyltransferase [Acidiphilium]|uniref:Release factor glutamine methyltransferase n=1 Tax=Acidiphilium rubrum TaxID=526 RepID=A0A8G2FL85_ACIRU|nr:MULTISPECIES: peptide chain release factor N(5)-glutamine methyltransferase [Acidiphilium]SIQ33170.1 release factor glutamine methyltransferase [Acidiphilium rubrum]